MDGADAKDYFLALPGAYEDFPFGPDVHVFKVNNKMFGTLGWEADLARINLKCEPEQAVFLRQMFAAVLPGYHMNKQHWNTVLLDGTVPRGELERMIEHSFALVVKKLPKAERVALEIKHGKQNLYRA
ncbi:MAG: MmcQ/YjbR family DNA-binding protein [Pseudomonadota bacterium]